LAGLICLWPAGVARGQLSADELLLVYNRQSAVSQELAEHYAGVRGVPEGRLLGVDVLAAEGVHRWKYESQVAEPIRRYLIEQGLAEQVRCLLCFYDMPLRVGRYYILPSERSAFKELDGRLSEYCVRLNEQAQALQALLKERRSSRPTTTRPVSAQRVLAEYGQARVKLARQLERGEGAADGQVRQEMANIIRQTEGLAGYLAGLRRAMGELKPLERNLLAQQMQTMQRDRLRVRGLLSDGPAGDGFWEGIGTLERTDGLAGVIRLLHAWQRTAEGGKETVAAVDSELALLWHGRFPVDLWTANPLYTGRFADPAHPDEPRTLFVSRLDGPTPAVVRRMIDDAVATEKEGLRGRFYIDARGTPGDDPYAQTDQRLLALAKRVEDVEHLPMVLDRLEPVFPPNSCPQAALYCGWYNHKQYVPAFQFVRGAVGWHIASSEAVSLRTPKGYWCPHLLQDGCVATLGPVREPYLASFPDPDDFFALLLCGRFTLAEVFGYTQPALSWQMILLGDPLYRPFAKNPVLDADEVMAELSRAGGQGAGNADP
jgi:uncharacterized protein (TIGR03790 family)